MIPSDSHIITYTCMLENVPPFAATQEQTLVPVFDCVVDRAHRPAVTVHISGCNPAAYERHVIL